MTQNQINTHPLLQKLTNAQRNELSDKARFLPIEHGQPIQLDVEDLWNALIIVAAGHMTVHTESIGLDHGPGDCLGTIRLVKTECPFTKVEVSANTHLIYLPWDSVAKLVHESEAFRQACMIENGEVLYRFGLI
jgi:hypothetical protein